MPRRKQTCKCNKDTKRTESNLTLQKHEVRKFNCCTGLYADKLINTPRSSQIKIQNPDHMVDILDTINCGESLIKPTTYSNETEKSIEFWKSLKEQKDITPKRAVIEIKVDDQIEADASKATVKGKVKEESIIDWTDILKDIQRLQLDKTMVTRGLQCEFCKVTPYETPVKNAFEDDVNEIIELNHWRPVKISEAMTQTSAIKFNDKATDKQSTESFKIMYKVNKPKEYVDKGTDIQNPSSLLKIPQKGSTTCSCKKTSGQLSEGRSSCTCSQLSEDVCPYDVVDCTCGQANVVESALYECPYHKISCTCGESTGNECPYHKVSCTCGEPTANECPYHKISCTCGEPTANECPYHKINCTCGKPTEFECAYHRTCCTCGEPTENEYYKMCCTCFKEATKTECPYHKVSCICGESAETVNLYHKLDHTPEEPARECPYHQVNCICGEAAVNENISHKLRSTSERPTKECPYHKKNCTCDNLEMKYVSSNRDKSLYKDIPVKDVCPYRKESCNCKDTSQKDERSASTCPYEKDACNCGNLNIKNLNLKSNERIDEVVKSIINILEPKSGSCTCSITSVPEDIAEEIIDCPYRDDLCDCKNLSLDSSTGILPCPYDIDNCQCNTENKKLREDCLEIVLECTCGDRIQKCSCDKDEFEKVPCPYEIFDCKCGIEKCPYNLDNCNCANKGVCQCDYPQVKCPNNSQECNCVIEKIPCPYGKKECTCGKDIFTGPTKSNLLCKISACTCDVSTAPNSTVITTDKCICNTHLYTT